MNLSFLKLLCSTAKNANLFLIPVLTHAIHGGELAQEERVGNFLVNFSLVDNSDCQKKKKKKSPWVKSIWTNYLCRLNNPDGYLSY